MIGARVTWLTAGMLLLNWNRLPGNVRPSLRWWRCWCRCAQPSWLSGRSRPIERLLTISIGVAALESSDQQFSHLRRRADRAMYAAKTDGRNPVMVADGQQMPQGMR